MFSSSTHDPSTIATGLAQRPQEWLGPNEEDAFVHNWIVPCTIGLVLYPWHYKITIQAVKTYSKLSQPHDKHRLNRIKSKTMLLITENINNEGHRGNLIFKMILNTSLHFKVIKLITT